MDCSGIAVEAMGRLKSMDFKTLKVMTLVRIDRGYPTNEYHNVVVIDNTGQIEKLDLDQWKIVSLKP